jgi:membrane protein
VAVDANKLSKDPTVSGSIREHLGRLRQLAGTVFVSAFRHNATGAATQFSYNAFLSLIPFLFILVSMIGLFGGDGVYTRSEEEFNKLIPEELSNIFRVSIAQAGSHRGQFTLALVVAIPVSLYVIGNATGALISAVERAHNVEARPWIHEKLVAIAFAIMGIGLVLGTTVALVGGTRLVARIVGLVDVHAAKAVGPLVTYPISIGAIFLFTLLLYRFGPKQRTMGIRRLIPGAVFALAIWIGATTLFGLYARRFDNYAVTYGRSYGFVVVYLIFAYITGLSLVIGAEINSALSQRRNRDALLD